MKKVSDFCLQNDVSTCLRLPEVLFNRKSLNLIKSVAIQKLENYAVLNIHSSLSQ